MIHLKRILKENILSEAPPPPKDDKPSKGNKEEPAPEEEPEEKGDEEAPKQVTVIFDPSAVKRYNDVRFMGNQGVVEKIGREGIEATVGDVHIFINFQDIRDEV